MLSRTELFARLEEGHAARITVVTPNRRLALALAADFDAHQRARGLSVWEAADILPIGAFIERLWEDALYSGNGGRLPLLLSAGQEHAIWESILQDSGLLSIPQTATQCREAWRLVHGWRIVLSGQSEDAAAFKEWCMRYEARTQGETDAARLPDVVAGVLPVRRSPKLLVAYAFDLVPPQLRAFLEKFRFLECRPPEVPGTAGTIALRSPREELAAAAAWARARLEAGCARIGVVVPDLARRRKQVVRVFSRMMQPGYNLPGTLQAALPFNVSLGEPLADHPLAAAALTMLRVALREVPFEEASRLLRSPFVGGAEVERSARARLDSQLRAKLGATVSLARLVAAAANCARWRSLLEKVFDLKPAERQSPGRWARHFSALLAAAGFPGERTLDSTEFQAQARWHEALGELAQLERVSAEMSAVQALDAVERICRDTLFQPETPQAPIQVLGVLESAGLRFDCLWVSGLTDEAWPMEPRPNPFVPIALQKKAGVPQASADDSAALDRRLTEEWRRAAREVVFSHPAKEDDRDLAPSRLIAGLPEARLQLPSYPRYRDQLFALRRVVSTEEARAPARPAGPVRGGTRVLADQAACPFRAFAHFRLHAQALEAPSSGPDARARGVVLHAMLRNVWKALKNSASLKGGDLSATLESAAAGAVKEGRLEGRFAQLERARLVRLAAAWLEIERARPDFEVVALEEKRVLQLAGLELSARIDRMDRVERGHVLIDYKTGARVTPKSWEGERPDDPQLPLYAVAANEALAAVAFAKVRAGEMRFMGFSREENLIAKVKAAHDWDGLLHGWKTAAESLAAAFSAGDASVDPKSGPKTCAACDLQTLCRIHERLNGLDESEEAAGE